MRFNNVPTFLQQLFLFCVVYTTGFFVKMYKHTFRGIKFCFLSVFYSIHPTLYKPEKHLWHKPEFQDNLLVTGLRSGHVTPLLCATERSALYALAHLIP